MRIIIAAVGRMKAGPERELCERYVERACKLARRLGYAGPDVAEIDEGRSRQSDERRNDEARRLAAMKPAGGRMIALDEGGRTLSTMELAEQFARWRDGGAPAAVIAIGGPDGHGVIIRDEADMILSFGRLTWPHMLVRIMLAEQIYRVMSLQTGHPYHRA